MLTHCYACKATCISLPAVRRLFSGGARINATEVYMKTLRWRVLAMACLLLSACQDRRDPVKPTTVAQVAIPAAATVATA